MSLSINTVNDSNKYGSYTVQSANISIICHVEKNYSPLVWIDWLHEKTKIKLKKKKKLLFFFCFFGGFSLQNMRGWSTEPAGAMAKWKSTVMVTGKVHATQTGPKMKKMWCAQKLTVAPLPLRGRMRILERHLSRADSKPSALGTRPLLDSAPLRTSQKTAWMPALFAQVSSSLVHFHTNTVWPQNHLHKSANRKKKHFSQKAQSNDNILEWHGLSKDWFYFFSLQTANPLGCKTGRVAALAEWKSSTRGPGELFAMTNGACRKSLSCADSWIVGHPYKQSTRHTLAVVRVAFGWTTWSAMDERKPSVTARRGTMGTLTATTMKMLVWFAQVIKRANLFFLPWPSNYL